MDPPYPLTEDELAKTLQKVALLLEEHATIMVERSSRSDEPIWPEGITRFAEKKYGETRLWFAEPVQVAAE